MRNIKLSFPDMESLAAFVYQFHIAPADVNSSEQTLNAYLSEELIQIACTEYNAVMKRLAA